MIEMNLIQAYGNFSAEKRIDIIRNNYPNFLEIVDGYIEGLCYMIEYERGSNGFGERDNLGMEIQIGNMKSEFMQKKAIRNVLTREALLKCDFSGDVLDGVEKSEDYIRDAKILREMRRDYNVFRSQLGMDWERFGRDMSKAIILSEIVGGKG